MYNCHVLFSSFHTFVLLKMKSCFHFGYGFNIVLDFCQDLVGSYKGHTLPRQGEQDFTCEGCANYAFLLLLLMEISLSCLLFSSPTIPELVSTWGVDLIILAPWGVPSALS